MPYNIALDKLKEYSIINTSSPITFHCAFIKGENDNLDDIDEMIHEINKRDFEKLKFNIVKFNPHKNSVHKETDKEILDIILKKFEQNTKFTNKNYNSTRIVPRVGPDSYASCGMFINDF